MLMLYPCDQQYPFGSSGVMSRIGFCWCCWFVCQCCCPPATVGGVVAHKQIARRCYSVAMVAVAARNSFVNVVLLLLNPVTACRSCTVAVARFARASVCCCCISSSTVALEYPTLVQCAPYPSYADVRGKTQISRKLS